MPTTSISNYAAGNRSAREYLYGINLKWLRTTKGFGHLNRILTQLRHQFIQLSKVAAHFSNI
jgi:hypothetical protein